MAPPSFEISVGGLRQDGQTRLLAFPMTPSAPFWNQKPWWCQPWSIVTTGSAVSVASWLLLQRWWITAPVVAAVLVWWWLFLVLVPGATAADLRLQATADRDEEPQASSGAADQGVSKSADLDQ